jgi:type I restriction enzyme, S subunit
MDDLKPGWKRVKFGEVVRQVKSKVDPATSGLKRFVAGEHMDTDELRIRRWGDVGDGYLGPAFHLRFKPGQVLYGSRRTYLRKVAVADFEGICANTTFILETANQTKLLPEFLPYIMTTEAFHEHSKRESKGSVNPYVNFSDLAWYEFALPPLEEQRRIISLLAASNKLTSSLTELKECLDLAIEAFLDDILRRSALVEQVTVDQICNEVTVGIVVNPSSFYEANGVLAISHSNIQRGFIAAAGAQRISAEGHRAHAKSWLHRGDVVLPRVSTLQGRPYHAAVVGDELNNTNAIGILILRPSSSVLPWYLCAVLNAPRMRRRLFGASVGSIQRQLNVGAIRRFNIGLLPLHEQRAIGDEFEILLDSFQDAQRRVETVNSRERALLNEVLGGSK